jgi:beta-mannan synthase
MIFNFFIARRTVLYLYTFFFFSILLPMSIIFPEMQIPTWQLVYIPAAITLLNSVGTPRLDQCLFFNNTINVTLAEFLVFCRSIHLIVVWFLFENVMALHRFKATLIGIFEAGRANEWIVTQKLGNVQKLKSIANGSGNCRFKNR